MTTYTNKSHLLNRLNMVITAAKQTRYYQKSAIPIPQQITSINTFKSIKPTPILEFRAQRLSDTLTDLSKIEWIVGLYGGQSPLSMPFAEDSEASRIRQELYEKAIGKAGPFGSDTSAVVISTHVRRYLAAELASILVRMGITAHLFVDLNLGRLEDILKSLKPSILVVLDEAVTENLIPESVNLCVTVRRTHEFTERPQVDLFIIDELGLLGHSFDRPYYSLNHAEYYFEHNKLGRLIVTPLYNLVQPKLRIETLDRIEFNEQTYAKLTLAPDGG